MADNNIEVRDEVTKNQNDFGKPTIEKETGNQSPGIEINREIKRSDRQEEAK